MALRLNGSTSGYVELNAAATSASNTLTLPNGNGSSGQYLQTNGSGALSWASGGYTWLSTVSFSGSSSVTITGINTNARDILVVFSQISGNSGGEFWMRAGNTTIDTNNNYWWSTYSSGVGRNWENAVNAYKTTTSGYTSSGHSYSGHIRLTRVSATGIWAISHVHGSKVDGPSMGGGFWNNSSGIGRLLFTPTTGSFDDGEMTVGYI